ncbi:modification methylase NgoFVII [Aspergillus udagawae]|nr:modification methylase NgoFVII [Aspergillus udagawae]
MNRPTNDSLPSQELPQPSEPIYVGDSDDSGICDTDSDTDSSVTVDNDPDRSFFLDDEQSHPGGSRRTPTPFPIGPQTHQEIIDLTSGPELLVTEGDYLTDECFERLLRDWGRPGAAAAPLPIQEAAESEKRPIDHACVDGIVYKAGHSLELHNGLYLRIATVLQDSAGEIFFQGRHLIRTRNHKGTYIPKWSNELVWIVNESTQVPLSFVKRFVNIRFTSCCHFEQDLQKQIRPNDLFCRLKENLDSSQSAVEYLSFQESDEGFAIDSKSLRESWRGETRPFGSEDVNSQPQSQVIVLDADPVIDLTETEKDAARVQKKHRKYTFGDGFCGAGGVSCGASKAGLHIKWAFDKSEHAITTYRLNFATAVCEACDIFCFLTNEPEFLKVDVSHGSPPCQTFSPAHTISSENDDANSACIFSCADMIKKSRPRVHTMEETSGLFDRHKETFHRVIQDFIEIGYSVRWRILNCMDYGVPQSRRRLIIIASGPGELLPPFPKPTHGLPGSGLFDYTTINQMIANIPPDAPDHDIEGARSRGLRNGMRVPFDANRQAKTVTCSGGENNYHPSGTRGFTNREFACLQTFPLDYRFAREVRKQIGNAVPPALSKAIYREIIKSLQRTDEQEFRAGDS